MSMKIATKIAMEIAAATARFVARTTVVVALGAGALGCGSGNSTKTRCQVSIGCEGDNICVDGTCLQRPSGRIVAFEITPPSASPAGPTEIPMVMLSGDPLALATEDKASIVGVVSSQRTLFAEEAHVVVTIPSRIPGRANLQVGTDMAMNQFTFAVAKGRVGPDTVASFRFIPGMTAQTQPPVSLQAPLAPMLAFTFPTSTQMTAVRGQLLDHLGQAFPGDLYPARISFNSVQISNVRTADAMGFFQLLVPRDSTPAAPADIVTLTIDAADTAANVPQFLATPESLATIAFDAQRPSTQIYVMPDFLPATMFSARVTADGKAQAGVTVRFRTEIPAPPNGSAIYERSAVSDAKGNAQLPLIPGTAALPRLYQVSLLPPADPAFRFASQCLGEVTVAVTDAGVTQSLPAFTLQPKHALSGSVSDSTSAPVAAARVTATQIAAATTCPTTDAPNPAIATTDASGNYLLLVEPGTYRIDVDPASASAWPRLTEDGAAAVTVSHATVHPISLPKGEVVEGIVTASDRATLLPGASVTIFEVFCRSIPCDDGVPAPVVLAQTQTDLSGNFRVVLPVP